MCSPFLFDPSDICSALVGLKGVRVLHYRRIGPVAEIAFEKIVSEVRCPMCGFIAHVKERPLVTYIDLPFGGTPTRIKWKKHRMICINLGLRISAGDSVFKIDRGINAPINTAVPGKGDVAVKITRWASGPLNNGHAQGNYRVIVPR